MDYSAMLSELRNESVMIAKVLKPKEETAEKYRKQLEVLDAEISQLRDQYDALKMAIDSLELVGDRSIHVPEPQKTHGRGVGYSKKPRKIGKFDPKGQKIGEFASLNVAAKQFGWTGSSLRKYIENTGKDKQIRLRGYYLEFLAA